MSQYNQKEIYIDKNARKELLTLPKEVQMDFEQLIKELSIFGFLIYPDGKKLSNYDLFEIRVRRRNIYRCIYAYLEDDIILLSFLRKKVIRRQIRKYKRH